MPSTWRLISLSWLCSHPNFLWVLFSWCISLISFPSIFLSLIILVCLLQTTFSYILFSFYSERCSGHLNLLFLLMYFFHLGFWFLLRILLLLPSLPSSANWYSELMVASRKGCSIPNPQNLWLCIWQKSEYGLVARRYDSVNHHLGRSSLFRIIQLGSKYNHMYLYKTDTQKRRRQMLERCSYKTRKVGSPEGNEQLLPWTLQRECGPADTFL